MTTASFHPGLLVLWCRVIFSNDGEQHGAVKAIISAAAQSSLTETSLSQPKEATHKRTNGRIIQLNKASKMFGSKMSVPSVWSPIFSLVFTAVSPFTIVLRSNNLKWPKSCPAVFYTFQKIMSLSLKYFSARTTKAPSQMAKRTYRFKCVRSK